MSGAVAAVDLGATSGRVIVGRLADGRVDLTTVHRFPNTPVATPDGLHWNILELYRNVLEGIAAALVEEPSVSSVAVDAWAVDYALMREGRMLGMPYHYRDERNLEGVKAVHEVISHADLYHRNGLQYLQFNTLYQLATEGATIDLADSMLLIPDLITYWLSGRQVCEITNASTTGLLDVSRRAWDLDLAERLALPAGLFNTLVEPGSVLGGLRGAVADSMPGDGGLVVSTVGSHDTASAVVGVPMTTPDAAFISCGTWGLVGVEVEHPILTDQSRTANFTNEGGVDGRVRFLHNVMGLWLLSESIRQWERVAGESIDLGQLLAQAADVEEPVPTFDANDARFLAPGNIPKRIAEYCGEHDIPVPTSRPAYVRAIVESLAAAFAAAVDQAAQLTSKQFSVVHVVGGGSQNELLCQLIADRCGQPVLAGPVEATALGNVLVQARAQGILEGDLEVLRSVVAASSEPVRYVPRSPAVASRRMR